jgi:hypothetical protein
VAGETRSAVFGGVTCDLMLEYESYVLHYIYLCNEVGNGNGNIHIEVQEHSSSEAHRFLHLS